MTRGMLLVVLTFAALAACGDDEPSDSAATETASPTVSAEEKALEGAYTSCSDLMVGNSLQPDKQVPAAKVMTYSPGSLIIDGDQFKSFQTATCIFEALPADAALVSKVGDTTSLMGRQEETSGGYDYTWSFHPDNGLDMIIEVSESS